ncbi:MAG: glycosyltransferase family 4 protein, partial [Verrucomicrobia bacterium]|nr:glycosyltransferase family 4 protein [Verrucomicrobiota bacterium]
MRVTHVITRLIVGGAQENTIASVLELSRRPGLEVRLISGPTTGPEGSLEARLAPMGDAYSCVPHLVRPVHPWKDWRALRRLTCLFRADSPAIVHTHSGKAGILGRLAAHRARVPIIVHTIHGPSFGRFQGPLANAVFRGAERLAARVTTHFVVVADAMQDQYLAAGIGQPNQYSRIVSGFDLHPFLAAAEDPGLRAELGFTPANVVVGKIARLFKLKGHADLLAIAPRLVERCPQLRFLLVGDGPWRERFARRVQRLGLEKHFVFAGLVPPDLVPRYLGAMDLLVHLSLREGLPRALPQALATARPVVAYDCDGAREVCHDNETGFLLSSHDLDGLADRVLRLAADPSLRQRLGQRGQQLVQDRFPLERMIDDLHAL